MVLLAGACILSGIFPAYVVLAIDAALPGALHGALAHALLPAFLVPGGAGLPPAFLHDFAAIGASIGAGHVPGPGLVLLHRGGTANPVVFAMSSTYIAAFTILLLLAVVLGVRILARRPARPAPVWAGGLNPLSPEMTYTATGFSNAVRVIFDAVFHPRTVEHSRHTVAEHFRVAITRERDTPFLGERGVTRPLSTATEFVARLVARLHHGRLEGYVFYALAALLVTIVVIAL
jgi:hypothetical protein